VIYEGILGKNPRIFGAEVWPAFSHWSPSIVSLTFTYISGQIPPEKIDPFLYKPLNLSSSPHFSSKALVHPLSYREPLQCFAHRWRHKEDPTIERGTTRQGHVVCFGRIDKPREGLRCCEGDHRRSQRTISEDSRPAGHGLWPFGPP
jgi:hypothetical protein